MSWSQFRDGLDLARGKVSKCKLDIESCPGDDTWYGAYTHNAVIAIINL